MPLPPMPSVAEGAIPVQFDTAAADSAMTALDQLLEALKDVDSAARSAGLEARAGWTGVSGTWFAQQLDGGTYSTKTAQEAVTATKAAIVAAANLAVTDQTNNNNFATWCRTVEEQQAQGAH